MSKKLLLADDSITIQKVIQITFANEDCQLTITDNGDTAYERARELRPDLILADVYMPGKNGYELCAAIKQTPALQHVPVLLLAGSFEPFDEARARAVGAADWIEKPFESQTLIDKVVALLSAAPAPAEAPAAMPVAAAEPAAEPFDPFAGRAFDTPAPAAPVWADGPDDWGRLELGNEPPPATALPDEFIFEDFAGPGPEFTLTDTAAPFAATPRPSAFVPPPAGTPDFAAFDDGEEVLPLGDDDILGVDDLEPLADAPTLTPWSRDAAASSELFPDFAEFIADPPPFDQPAPAVDVAPQPFSSPVAAPATAAAVAEPRALMLSRDELEQLVERAVARAIERLAGTVLEQVAWEVVPDLAEALIKEEIRQIKGTVD
jgi:CheY-like chemotaxis protein